MAGTFFSFDAPNAGGFSIAGSKFLIDGMDLSDAAPPFFRAVEKIARRQFQKGGSIADPEQEQWKPLSKRYAVWKVRYYKGPRGRFFPQVMTLSGKLQSALTRPNAPGAIRIGEAERFTYGALVRSDSGYDYGHAHQMGLVRGIARKTITPPVSGSIIVSQLP